jgi:glyoxylase-like metal-dependent hydrolase (beta-lactamase superfamily II)
MTAAGLDPREIKTILISHFHPDHIFGLMEKGTNKPTFPDAELIVTSTEYSWWTEAGRVEKLPEARKGLGQRIQATFPQWKNFTLVEGEKEVVPGIRLINAPGHTPGHAAYLVTSGNQQLMISNDTAYVPALTAPHPEWQGAYDQDGPLAVATRKALLDRVIAEKMMICGAHFPFPGAGVFQKDGAAYAFTPVKA